MVSEIEDICKKLHKDYNGRILADITDDEVYKAFKIVSEEYKDGNKGNIPLLNIIYNYFNGILPVSEFISGPMSLSYQTSDEYNMKIYIFGEHHGNEKSCSELKNPPKSSMSISQYLQKLFLNTDKFIDFYFEDAIFNNAPVKDAINFIDILANNFINCLNPVNREKCPYKNLRTHSVDVRSSGNIFNWVTKIGKLRRDVANYGRKLPPEIVKKHQELFTELSRIDSYESISRYILNIALNELPIVKKEIDRCIIPKNILIDTLYTSILETFNRTFTEDDIRYISRAKKPTGALMELLIAVEAPIVDVYTIARMFKVFRHGNNFPTKPKYIIYYAGNEHSFLVRTFLNKLKFKQHFFRQSDMITSVRCLNMKGLRLDFK